MKELMDLFITTFIKVQTFFLTCVGNIFHHFDSEGDNILDRAQFVEVMSQLATDMDMSQRNKLYERMNLLSESEGVDEATFAVSIKEMGFSGPYWVANASSAMEAALARLQASTELVAINAPGIQGGERARRLTLKALETGDAIGNTSILEEQAKTELKESQTPRTWKEEEDT